MRTRTLAILLVAGLLAGVVGISAQAPAGPPKPGPEHKRLGYFVGTWTSTGDMKASIFGPAGKMTMTETCKWFDGGFSVVCNSSGKSPMGDMKGMAVMSYNAEEKVYHYYAVDNWGMTELSSGTVKGNTWDWTATSKMQGKVVKGHFWLKEDSPTAYSYKYEMSVDGAPMAAVMEGKATKGK